MSDVAQLIVSVSLLVTALASLVVALSTRGKVDQVHVLTNNRMTEMVARVDQLTSALEKSDTEVPPAPKPPRKKATP